MALSGNIAVTANMSLTADPVGAGASIALALQFAFSQALTDGTTANKVNRAYFKRLSLTTTPTSLTMSSGLVDIYGAALAFVEVVGIFVKNNSSTAGQNVVVGGNGSGLEEWISAGSQSVIVKPGGVFCSVAPGDPAYAVIGGAADILDVAAAAGTPTADVMILGRSA